MDNFFDHMIFVFTSFAALGIALMAVMWAGEKIIDHFGVVDPNLPEFDDDED